SVWINTLEAIAWSRRGLEFWYKRTWPRVLIHRYVDTQICCSWLYTPSDGKKLLRREANLPSRTSSRSETDLESQAEDFHSPKG
ncbi:unnamed protein product, partial [Brassica napus]